MIRERMDLCLDQIEKLLTGVYTISPEFNNTRAKINRIVEFRIGEFLETRTPNDYKRVIEFYAVRLLNNGPNSVGIHQQLTYHLIKYLGFSIEKRQDLLEFLLGKNYEFRIHIDNLFTERLYHKALRLMPAPYI